MSLMAMLEEVLNVQAATAIVATPATHKPKMPSTVATVAGVAVASSPKHETEARNLTLACSVQSEHEARLCDVRLQSFHAKGIATDEAQYLADQLANRDRELDDRRSCAECLSFYAGRCKSGLYPIGEATIHTLHRCRGFKLSENLANDFVFCKG